MSTREIAYHIFEQLTEKELEGFVALFEQLHPVQDSEDSDMEKIRRPIPDLDEKRN